MAINNVVSQSVPHLHVHVVPRTKGDGLRGFFWPRTTYAEGEIEEVRETDHRGAGVAEPAHRYSGSRHSPVEIAGRAETLAVAAIQADDLEARVIDQPVDGPVQVTAPGQPAVHRVDSLLPAVHPFVG